MADAALLLRICHWVLLSCEAGVLLRLPAHLLRLRLRNQTANSAEKTMPLPRSIWLTDADVVSSPTLSRIVATCAGDGRRSLSLSR